MLQVRCETLKVSVEHSPRRKAALSNMLKAESFLKKTCANAEAYVLCTRNSEILSRTTSEDLGEPPEGCNAWIWHRANFLLWFVADGLGKICSLTVCWQPCTSPPTQEEKRAVWCPAMCRESQSALSTLVQHISELEEWAAIFLQELSFKDELSSMDELEASLGGHKLATNPRCRWDTAILIHSWCKGALRWYASSRHALCVVVKAGEDFTFCSAQLPSWVHDSQFERRSLQCKCSIIMGSRRTLQRRQLQQPEALAGQRLVQ